MKHRFMTATAIAVSVPLSGCAGIFDFATPKSASAAPERDILDMSEYFERRLAAGHLHLSRGHLSKAATAFRQATRNPSTAAAAYNGLAITYDRLGRTDLAENYFRQAVKFAQPDDFRYSRNLARFEGKQLRDKIDREASNTPVLAKRPEPAPTAVEQFLQKSPAKTSKQASFEEAFADLASDAPLVKPAVKSIHESRGTLAEVGPAAITSPVTRTAAKPVVVSERPAVSTRSVRISNAASPIRTTGRLVAPDQIDSPTRSPGIRVESRRVRLVRISDNEVVIGRSANVAQAKAAIPARAAPIAGPSKHGEPSANGVSPGSTDEEPTEPSTGSSPDGAAKTPLALVDAWTNIQAGI